MLRTPERKRPSIPRPLSAPRSTARYLFSEPPLCIRRNTGHVSRASLVRDAFEIPAAQECLHWVQRQTFRATPFPDRGTDVSSKSVLQTGFRPDEIRLLLRRRQTLAIHEGSLGEKLLRHVHGLDHGFNLAFQVVTLIDHVSDVGTPACFPFEKQDFVE